MALACLRAAAWAYYFLPWPLRRACGAGLGISLWVFGLRSRVVAENLAIAFPGRRRPDLTRAAYLHLGQLVFEILLLLGPMRRHTLRTGVITGTEHWDRAKKLGHGVLMVSSHVGNWEIMAATGALRHGIDIMLVTKHLKPEWLHQAIERGRNSCSVLATYEPRTLRDVLRHLKNNGTVGFVLDQYAGPPVGLRVPFFGVPVGTSTALATLAKRTGAVVLPVVNYRTPDGKIRIEIQPPIPWIEEDEPRRELAVNTARYAATLEKHILAHPDQWLWTHRRFKGDLSPLRDEEWREARSRT